MSTASEVVKNKPVATVGSTAAIVTAVLGYAVFRGWIPSDLGALLEPVAVVLAGLVVHALVSPYQKVKAVIERGLNITDADYGRLEAILEQYGLQLVEKVTAVPAEVSATEPAAPTTPAA